MAFQCRTRALRSESLTLKNSAGLKMQQRFQDFVHHADVTLLLPELFFDVHQIAGERVQAPGQNFGNMQRGLRMAFQKSEGIFENVAVRGFHRLDTGGMGHIEEDGDLSEHRTRLAADGHAEITFKNLQSTLNQYKQLVMAFTFLDQKLACLETLLGQMLEKIENGVGGHSKCLAGY